MVKLQLVNLYVYQMDQSQAYSQVQPFLFQEYEMFFPSTIKNKLLFMQKGIYIQYQDQAILQSLAIITTQIQLIRKLKDNIFVKIRKIIIRGSMQYEKIKMAFEKKGYNQNSYIDKKQYFRILNSITPGGDFHEEVADELWTQASGDQMSNQIRINDICNTIVDAQNILKQRISQTDQQISSLQNQKRKLQSNPSRQSIRKIEQIDMRLDQLYEQKQSFQDDYRLVTEPFGIQLVGSVLRHQYPSPTSGDFGHNSNRHYDSVRVPQKYDGHVESEELKLLFYLTLAYGFIQVIVIYGKYDFLNLIVLTCLLSIYFLNFFDRVYIQFTLGIIAVSNILDLVWLIMYASQKWNPPQIGNDSIYQTGYLRFIVFFTAVLMAVKCGLWFYLFKHRNTDTEDKYMVSLGLMKILLNANRSNPISKGLSTNFSTV